MRKHRADLKLRWGYPLAVFGAIGLLSAASANVFAQCPTNANGTTLLNASNLSATSPPTFAFTGLTLTVNKISNQSFLFYTNTITYQFSTAGPFGAQFMMRVKNASGTYIMPNMITGGVSTLADASNNASLADTVFDTETQGTPPAGTYTFELWALAGGGVLTIVPTQSTIAVLEIPAPGCSN